MKEDKQPYPFEMPCDRLLTKAERLILETKGVHTDYIKCEGCSNKGWTTDGRKYCSIKCYCVEHGFNPDSFDLVRRAVYLDQAACNGDRVVYDNCIMDVVATDCTTERIKRGYSMKYNYVLKFNGKLLSLKELDTPLQKVKIDFEDI